MSSKKTIKTVDRSKALKFIQQQEFYKMERQQEKVKQQIILKHELKSYQNSNDNHTYAHKVCVFIIERHLTLLSESLAEMMPTNPDYCHMKSTFDRIAEQTKLCIENKITEFYKACDLPQRYQYKYDSNAIDLQTPPNKKQKTSHSNNSNNINSNNCDKKTEEKAIPKTKEQMEKEKLQMVKLPKELLNTRKLQQWLDTKLIALKEYEQLLIKTNTKTNKQFEIKKSIISNLRRDIDILKSTVLQQSSYGLRDNMDLKRAYLDIHKMDSELPILREKYMKPEINTLVAQFDGCDVIQSIHTQQQIKCILNENKFNKKAKQFCNINNKHLIQHLLFESEINNELNDDLELLKDFGVKYVVKQIKKTHNGQFNLRVIFEGHYEREMKVPNLVVLINEKLYKHYYEMVPRCEKSNESFMDFVFVLKEKRGIKRGRNNNKNNKCDDDDFKMDSNGNNVFGENHIKWLQKYKTNMLKSNGEFVSIVNVYNFYHGAIKALSNEMCDKSKQKK